VNELFREFIGRECTITLVDYVDFVGTIEFATDGWVKLKPDEDGDAEIINSRYIISIQHYTSPKTKREKRKAGF
jgi:hypothetical protein